MEDTKTKLPSHESTIPLIARLDHLEFIMKYLERKQRCGNNNNNNNNSNNNNNNNNNINVSGEKQSSELAKKEAFFKGTLLDRVASLEQRLYQLCMEMDSSGSSYPLSRTSTQDSGESSSSQESKGEICYSFPTFNNLSNHGDKAAMPHLHNQTKALLELQEKCEGIKNPMKNSSNKNKGKKKKEKKGSNSDIVAKKRYPPISWPHLKLLGC